MVIARSLLTISLTIHPNSLLLQVGPLDCIQCPHGINVCKSLLVGQHLCVHRRTS